MNNGHDKKMLDENTNNFQGQNILTYEFSNFDEVATEEEGVKSSLCRFETKKCESFNFRSNQS